MAFDNRVFLYGIIDAIREFPTDNGLSELWIYNLVQRRSEKMGKDSRVRKVSRNWVLIRTRDPKLISQMKESFAAKGDSLYVSVDEQVVYDQLTENENALWGLLLAAGYLKVEDRELDENIGEWIYRLTLTNQEVEFMFRRMIRRWFGGQDVPWNDFVQAMISGNLEEMNLYMNRVAQETFSSFDTGSKPSEVSQPERFYHGFVLGLIAGETRRYEIRSNRESGYGRYDVAMIPAEPHLPAIVMEFKVHDPAREATLHDTACAALRQIRDRDYDRGILTRGVDQDRIRHYGFAFAGKKVLIESDDKTLEGKADEKRKDDHQQK